MTDEQITAYFRQVNMYREMFFKDMIKEGTTEQQAIETFKSNWTMAETLEDNGWTLEQRAKRKVWAGIGLLVFGDSTYIVDVIKNIIKYPEVTKRKLTRHYIMAITNLIPMPEGLSIAWNPTKVLKWIEKNHNRLVWNKETGYVLKEKMNIIDDFASWYREQVTKRAKLKWENAGMPEGRDLEFWTEAEKELPIPQSIGEVWGMGYGADDPGLVGIIERYKERYE